MSIKKTVILTFLAIVTLSSASYSQTVNCERYSFKGDMVFSSDDARDSWLPPFVMLSVSELETLNGRTAMFWTNTTRASNQGTTTDQRLTLLKNGKAILKLEGLPMVEARYKCDKTADEVREILATEGS